MTRRELLGALAALPLLVKDGMKGERVPADVRCYRWAKERFKSLAVERKAFWLPETYEREAQFTHPENGKRYGVRYSCKHEDHAVPYEKLMQIERKIDRSLTNALAFPEKAIVMRHGDVAPMMAAPTR